MFIDGETLAHWIGEDERTAGVPVVMVSPPTFYQKSGYELAWHLNDFPPGQQSCYLIKRFKRR